MVIFNLIRQPLIIFGLSNSKSSTLNNSSLIKNCVKGSRYHQRLLYDQYYSLAFNKAYKYLNNQHDTEDAVIIAFNNVFKNLFRFKLNKENSLRNWILTIVTNEALKIIKSKTKIKIVTDTIEHIEDDNSEEYNTTEAISRVHAILKTMPDGYRIVFVMHTIEGYRHQEIAEYLGINYSTSKSQLSKAKAYIRNRLKSVEL